MIIYVASIAKSKDSKNFFKISDEEGFIYKISEEEPKSYIVTEKVEKKNKGAEKIVKTIIYYSPISSTTLQKRALFMEELHEQMN